MPSKRVLYVLNALLVGVSLQIIATVAIRGFDLFVWHGNEPFWIGIVVLAAAALVSKVAID